MERRDLLTRDPASFPTLRDRPDASVHGILLAAGTSSRYGDTNKLLATVDGTPLVRHAAAALVDSAVDGVTVVVGCEAESVTDAFSGLDVTIRQNENYADGQSTSVRVGIKSASARDADAALVALGDMPSVAPATHSLLVSAYKHGVADCMAAAHEGCRGNPVLFDAWFFPALTAVDGDVGGRQLLRDTDDAVTIETADPGVLRDVDHPNELDYHRG
jgi:molybdenum cofactor cytidylyltransferase